MISLDAAKTNKEENIYVPENYIRPIENKKLLKIKIFQYNGYGKDLKFNVLLTVELK